MECRHALNEAIQHDAGGSGGVGANTAAGTAEGELRAAIADAAAVIADAADGRCDAAAAAATTTSHSGRWQQRGRVVAAERRRRRLW